MDMDRYQHFVNGMCDEVSSARVIENGVLNIVSKSARLVEEWHEPQHTTETMITTLGDLLMHITQVASGIKIPMNAIAVRSLEQRRLLQQPTTDDAGSDRFLFAMRNNIT